MMTAELQQGQVFGPYTLRPTLDEGNAYDTSLGSAIRSSYRNGTLPPLFLVAAALGKALVDLGIGKGAVHFNQEVSFHRAVAPGEELLAMVELRRIAVRAGQKFITIGTAIADADGEQVATAVSNVIIK